MSREITAGLAASECVHTRFMARRCRRHTCLDRYPSEEDWIMAMNAAARTTQGEKRQRRLDGSASIPRVAPEIVDTKSLTVGIVGAGRVGTALGVALARAGHQVTGASGRSAAARARIANRLPGRGAPASRGCRTPRRSGDLRRTRRRARAPGRPPRRIGGVPARGHRRAHVRRARDRHPAPGDRSGRAAAWRCIRR